jgi:hypothetical protein
MNFSMGMVYPKYQMVYVDLKTNSKHQIMPYYEHEVYSSKKLFFIFIYLHLNNISQILKLVIMIYQKYQISQWE